MSSFFASGARIVPLSVITCIIALPDGGFHRTAKSKTEPRPSCQPRSALLCRPGIEKAIFAEFQKARIGAVEAPLWGAWPVLCHAAHNACHGCVSVLVTPKGGFVPRRLSGASILGGGILAECQPHPSHHAAPGPGPPAYPLASLPAGPRRRAWRHHLPRTPPTSASGARSGGQGIAQSDLRAVPCAARLYHAPANFLWSRGFWELSIGLRVSCSTN